MRKILITGSEGFVGKNIQVHLRRREDVEIIPFDKVRGGLSRLLYHRLKRGKFIVSQTSYGIRNIGRSLFLATGK